MKIIKEILSFIIKQLDKLVLITILIIFILILMNLIKTINQTTLEIISASSNVLKINKYTSLNKISNSNTAFLKKTVLWEKSSRRNKNKKSNNYISAYSDFLLPFKIARSIAPEANNRLIPYQNYLIGNCPISNTPLPKPNTKQLDIYTSTYDYDEDGIPDILEKKYGLNPEDANDIWLDLDNDSFSNITEYRYNKDGISDPKIHPPLIERITLVKVANTKIPIFIKNILKTGYNKKRWKIQINIFHSPHNRQTKFLKIGDTFEVNKIKYTINDIREEYDHSVNPGLGIIEKIDKSSVILVDSLGQTIDAVIKEAVFEPNRRVLIKDLYTRIPIITKINNIITLGDKNTGFEKYKLISINNNAQEITFENIQSKQKFTVKKENKYKVPKTIEENNRTNSIN
jgi:hypothetical protein